MQFEKAEAIFRKKFKKKNQKKKNWVKKKAKFVKSEQIHLNFDFWKSVMNVEEGSKGNF